MQAARSLLYPQHLIMEALLMPIVKGKVRREAAGEICAGQVDGLVFSSATLSNVFDLLHHQFLAQILLVHLGAKRHILGLGWYW